MWDASFFYTQFNIGKNAPAPRQCLEEGADAMRLGDLQTGNYCAIFL